jgi:hypothetical protein
MLFISIRSSGGSTTGEEQDIQPSPFFVVWISGKEAQSICTTSLEIRKKIPVGRK